ncbi:hypothetical protein SAMN05444365_101466 [Micromonospora pattaloongensis]|uniref:Uncharacterized protein n=1 Tax=Micromonospora pattaloongensis TaxID=405436 RepID=A0A1H3GLY2_9ACTN|nr:replication initiator [Micromonospora pattaloongensis]SDY04107.1 hypothetical protein SAMN05444365_101466 [Micromonospora pattaloongensis]
MDRPISALATIAVLPITEHARTLIRTCCTLATRPQHKEVSLRRWAHQLGYRGHTATKSRRYSTTYTALRAARADHLRAINQEPAPADEVITEKEWRYTHAGHGLGQAMFAETIADDLRVAREAARAALADTDGSEVSR